jgi:aspartyl protease family protein
LELGVKIFQPTWICLTLLGLAGVALVYCLHLRFPDTLSSRDGTMGLVHTLLILAFVGGSALLHRQFQAHKVIRYTTIWFAIGGLVLIGYSFRHEAARLGNRLLADLVPSTGQPAKGSAMRFSVSADGHFVVEVTVTTDTTQVPIRFLVDTGASDVVISPADARRLGFDPGALNFSKVYQTANGAVYGAPVRLGAMTIGPIRMEEVRASINGTNMPRSLLGMSFLKRLSGYEVTSGSLILYP